MNELAPPFGARVDSYDLGDAVGTLVAEGGVTIRFGRSACRGFEPVVGAKVIVDALGQGFRGAFRATSVALDPGDRDGSRREAGSSVQHVVKEANAKSLVSVLLDLEAPDSEPAAIRAFLERFDFAAEAIRVDVTA